ncbi:MAG TPA: autotransporter outer membrane beta-barrel domain-containing protein [Gammaproteobacteria bacterium]|nr:autotransporter outer membrane beta-barrel domain-containing protein [Gammaproteobacteria bacterium]
MRIKRYGFIRSGLLAVFLLTGFMSPLVYGAAKSDSDFRKYMRERCSDPDFVTPRDPSDPKQLDQAQRNFDLCGELFPGVTGAFVSDANIVIFSDVGGGTTGGNGVVNGVKGRTGQLSVGGGQSWGSVSGGAEDGGFGLLLTDLSGETERSETELTSGYDSDLSGYLAGLDYSFSNVLVFGLAVGSVEEEANLAEGGKLETDSGSKTIYGTWSVGGGFSVDLYLGNGDVDYESLRTTVFGFDSNTTVPVEGIITASYEGTQDLKGLSLNYDFSLGAWSFGAFVSLDSIKSELDAYEEEGQRAADPSEPTGFELSFPSQKTESETTSLGLRAGYGATFGWGVLIPTIKYISVKENENDAREIEATLASDFDPQPLTLATDAPDRSYSTSGFSLIAAFNNGSQIFLDYEQRSGHDFIDTSSATLGALIAF